MFKYNKAFALLACLFIVLAAMDLSAKTAKLPKDKSNEEIQRTVSGAFDLQLNTVSRIWFYTTNYGILGHNVEQNVSGNRWPRGTYNQYIYATGIWFGCINTINDKDIKNVEISYNPNNGNSWMVPGRIEDGDKVSSDASDVQKYRTYFSTDYRGTGAPIISTNGEKYWPLWDVSPKNSDTPPKDTLRKNNYFGVYVNDVGQRSSGDFKQPAFISGEDIFCTYKDTDLDRYDDGIVSRRQKGYPLRLQYEQTIYTWGIGDYKDIMFVTYKIFNKSSKAYRDCWIATVVDADIGHYLDDYGAKNDFCEYYKTRPELNLGYQWSAMGTTSQYAEKGRGFGYLGMAMLETPAVDNTGTLRYDKKIFPVSEQLGMKSFKNWEIANDISDDSKRYDFISTSDKVEKNKLEADIRFLASTGPFNMKPLDSTKIVTVFIYANNAKSGDILVGNDTTESAELIRKTEFAYTVYYNNFEAPQPPERANLTWKPLNNAVELKWDTTSEMSNDVYEKGLDFMGYKIYRSRDKDLDTFDLNQIEAGTDTKYPSGKGPFGWKQVAEWSIVSPFNKSVAYPAVGTIPALDSLLIGGIAYKMDGSKIVDKDGKEINDASYEERKKRYVIDSNSIAFLRVPEYSDANYYYLIQNSTRISPAISYVVPSEGFGPWNKPLSEIVNASNGGAYFDLDPVEQYNRKIIKDVMFGKITFNIDRNPLYWKSELYSNNIMTDTVFIPKDDDNYYYKRETWKKQYYYRDTIINSEKFSVLDSSFTITRLKHITCEEAMLYPSHIAEVQKFVCDAIKNQKYQKLYLADFERSDEAVAIIKKYFKDVTNNRTFIDIGDDNRSAKVSTSLDPSLTEQMINNIDYYYKIISKDEGDAYQQSESKYNDGAEGLPNMVKAHPVASSIRSNFDVEVIYEDREKLGGLYDFKFFQIDQQRFTQLFKPGDTLELTFDPVWTRNSYQRISDSGSTPHILKFGLYHSKTKLYHITDTTNYPWDSLEVKTVDTTIYIKYKKPVEPKLIYAGNTYYEPELCGGTIRGMFTDKAASYIYGDSIVIDTISGTTITMGLPYSTEKVFRSGKFTTGDFKYEGYCYHYHPSYLSYMLTNNSDFLGAMNYESFGTIGFEFNYGMQQWGGYYRADTIILPPEVNIPVTPMHIPYSLTVGGTDQYVFDELSSSAVYADIDDIGYLQTSSFNNGPVDYTIKFTNSGTDLMQAVWGYEYDETTKVGKFTDSALIEVPYLEFEVYDNTNLDVIKADSSTFNVRYPVNIEKMIMPDTGGRWEPLKTNSSTLTDIELGRRRDYFPHPLNFGSNCNENLHKCGMVSFAKLRNESYLSYGSKLKAAWQMVFDKNNPVAVRVMDAYRLDRAKNYIYLKRDPNLKPTETERFSPPVVNVGQQNRYYLSTSVNGVNIDFQNMFYAGGCPFLFNFANHMFVDIDYKPYNLGPRAVNKNFNYASARDFRVGDTVIVRTAGGTLGLPLPGAKVRAVVRGSITDDSQISDKMMDQINVVPNPYYLAHQAVRSPYDSKLYFTRLPKVCTIEIYTVNGNKIFTLHHNDANTSEDYQNQESLEIWDLLTSTNQRVQSQSFIALIKAANGAQTIKNFSIVVPGARVITE